MIYVTHDQVEAMTLGQQIVVFNKGVLEQVGAPLDLYHNPANRFVGGFLGSPQMNFLAATVISQDARSTVVELEGGAGSLAFPGIGDASLSRECSLGIRPESLVLTESGDGWPATVDALEHLGDVSIVYARIQGVSKPIGVKVSKRDLNLSIDETVFLRADPGSVILFDSNGKAVRFQESVAIAA
jgi:multiple sugar transport system ATP-binding protein